MMLRVFHWIDRVLQAAEPGPYIEDREPVGWRACIALWLIFALMLTALVAVGVASAPRLSACIQTEAV